MLRSNVHNALGHDLPTLPILSHNENVAKKLARYSRAPLIRDLYDLWWYGVDIALEHGPRKQVYLCAASDVSSQVSHRAQTPTGERTHGLNRAYTLHVPGASSSPG